MKKVGYLIAEAAFALAAFATAAESRVKMKDLPDAVRQTVAEQSKGATLKGLAKEVENGKTLYEAELVVNGRKKDVLIDPAGEVVTVEEEVTLGSVPARVRSAFEQKAGKRKITLGESITEHGKLVAFEARFKSA